jgi:uncharacterized Ntn-hydrolase superfamily protein
MLCPVNLGTFSIVAADPESGEVGVAVQSKYFAVGAVVPWAQAGVGAVATQAAGVAAFGPAVLVELETGTPPDESIAAVLGRDSKRETRQLGAVTADGRAASFTGSRCLPWAGHVAGGDRRGQQSAAMVIEQSGAATMRRDGVDRTCDLRVDDHEHPIAELRRLFDIHQRWDLMRRSLVHYEEKDYAPGIALVESGLQRFPDDAMLLYTLACYESLAGRYELALAHLRRSVELDAQFREAARDDDDFEGLRTDAEFRQVVGS